MISLAWGCLQIRGGEKRFFVRKIGHEHVQGPVAAASQKNEAAEQGLRVCFGAFFGLSFVLQRCRRKSGVRKKMISQKGWFWRMFPWNINRNDTRVHSNVPPQRKPERGYGRMLPRNENGNEGTLAKTTLLRNRLFCLPVSKISWRLQHFASVCICLLSLPPPQPPLLCHLGKPLIQDHKIQAALQRPGSQIQRANLQNRTPLKRTLKRPLEGI